LYESSLFFDGRVLENKELTPWGRIPLQKLIVAQLIKKFPMFFETRSFSNVFTKAGPYPEPDAVHSLTHSILILSRITTVAFIFLSAILGIFCPLVYIDRAASGFSFQAFFPNVLNTFL
jgi:hypothetical protein